MVWEIPYTFRAGTKARANEVNENFTSAKQFVDALEIQASTNEINITNLENNKADLNGSNAQRFQVADPTTSFDAMNLQTFEDKTLNSRGVIDGFKLSKFNNNTINATAGNCYDATYKYMISSSTSLQESAETMGGNATYYVYVCADEQTSSNELVFSLSPTTPELPQDFDYFRRLGYFTTDTDGNIDQVHSDSETQVVTESELEEDSGYIELPNGFKLQWGYLQATGTNSKRTVTFPVPFTKFGRVVASADDVLNTDNWDRGLVGAKMNGLTSFTLSRGIVAGDGYCTWIAIGV